MKHPISTLPYEMNSVIEAGTDLNDYRTAGIFFFSYANRPTNLPPDGYGNGWCLVFPSSINSENYCTQIWISFGNNATTDARNKPIARRTYFNGTWTDWWKLPCTGEYTSPTDVTNAITTALVDYIPRNTTEVTATTEAEFEQVLEALPQSPPKIYFFHVLQGTSTRIGLPSGRYGIEVYAMGSTLRTVIAYSYNNDQKTFKKIRTAGASGTWSSWLDITNTDTLSNLGTTVTNIGTQVATNTTNISTLQNDVDDIKSKTNYIYKYYIDDQTGLDLLFNNNYSDVDIEDCTIYVSNGTVQIKMWGLMNNSKTGSVTNPANIIFPNLKFFKPVDTVKSCGFTTGATSQQTVNTLHPTSGGCEVYYYNNIGQGDQLGVTFTYLSLDATDLETRVDPTLGDYKTIVI